MEEQHIQKMEFKGDAKIGNFFSIFPDSWFDLKYKMAFPGILEIFSAFFSIVPGFCCLILTEPISTF